jgi:transposase
MGTIPGRYIGLDIHKEYFVPVGVNAAREVVFGPQKVSVYQLDNWISKNLTPQDAIVLEMTANAYTFYDALLPHVHSVIVVHPQSVSLVTKVPVKTDKKAALALAQLHAAGLLSGIWIPPQPVRDLRAIMAQREKLVRLSTVAKNRLHAVLHRNHLILPEKPFAVEQRVWWEALPLTPTELIRLRSDLDTLEFARHQIEKIETFVKQESAWDPRVPILIQLPGIGMTTAMTILAAIGDITRFQTAKELVGYAGLGARVHMSGMTYATGRISKAGRKDLRQAMVNAANNAVQNHPHWKAQLARMEPRLGRSKAIVAIARKLLVSVWHVLTTESADRFGDPRDVACSFFRFAYKVGVKNLTGEQSALTFTRNQLDRLAIGKDLQVVPWGSKDYKLPPSSLPPEQG